MSARSFCVRVRRGISLLGLLLGGCCLWLSAGGAWAQAASTYWNGGGSDSYLGTPANWVGNVPPTNDGNANLVFDDSHFAAGSTSHNLKSLLETNYAINTLSFAGASAYTLGGTGVGLTIGSGITQNSTVAQTISVPTFLSDDQTWTFGSGAGALTFNSADNPNGQIRLQGHTLTLAPQGNNVLNGSMGDAGSTSGLSVNGPGTISLTGKNTYTGTTTLARGTLNLGSSGAIGNSGPIVFGGGTLQYSAANQTDYSGRFSQAAGQSYLIDTNGQSVTFANALTSNGGSLNKLGAGTLTLTGANTYTASTTVYAGTLAVTGSIGNSSGSLLVDNKVLGAATATLSLSGTGSSISTGNALVGVQGSGTINQSDGSFTTNGNANHLTLGGFLGGAGTYNLGGGTLTTGATLVGDGGTGTFTQMGGTHTTGVLGLSGGTTSSQGTYTLSGGTLKVVNIINHDTSTSTTGTSTFNFNGGTLQITKSGVLMQGLTTANVQAGGAIINTAGFDTTVAQNLVHDTTGGAPIIDGGLLKLGTGTLTLSGVDTYTGITTVRAGTLVITGRVSSEGNSLLVVRGPAASPASVILDGTGSSLSTSEADIGIGGSGNFTQSGGSNTTNGNALYIGYGGNGVGSYSLSGASSSLSTDVTVVGFAGGVGSFTQTGGTHTTGALLLGAGSRGTYTLTGGTLNVASVRANNNGSQAGGTSTFNFNGGTLQASASRTDFFGNLTTANVQAGGAVIDTQSYDVTVSQDLLHDTTSGAPTIDGGLTKLGGSTLTLTGASTYTGATSVNAGTLAINGSLSGTGKVAVAAGATLAGGGTVAGAVYIVAGGTFSPGQLAAGRLTLRSSLSLIGAATAAFTLGGTVAGSGYTQALVAGQIDLGNQATLSLSLASGYTPAVGDKFYLLDETGTQTAVQGMFANAPTNGAQFTLGGVTYEINYQDHDPTDMSNAMFNDVSVIVRAVPEPSAWVILGAGAAGAGFVALRRRRAVA